MIKSVWSMAMLDLLLWRRMPFAIASALVPPLAMALLLVVLSLAVLQQPVALVVEGTGPKAQKMAKIIQSDDDAYLLTTTDALTAKKMLFDQEVAAIITVPADFDSKIKEKKVASVQLLLNNIDIDFADDIRRSVDRSVALFDAPKLVLGAAGEEEEEEESDLAGQAILSEEEEEEEEEQPWGNNPYLVDIDGHDLRKTNVEWLNYQVIPVLVLIVLNVGLVGTALLCAQDIERKTARYLLLTPQKAWVLVAGRLLGGFLASTIALIPALIVCVALGTISPPAGHWPALVAVFGATAFFAAGFGAFIGTVLTGSRSIAMACTIIATYLFFLGGGFTTIAFLPEWLRVLSSFVPTRYAIDGMRKALFYDTLAGIPTDLAVLCTTALVFLALGSLSIRRAYRAG